MYILRRDYIKQRGQCVRVDTSSKRGFPRNNDKSFMFYMCVSSCVYINSTMNCLYTSGLCLCTSISLHRAYTHTSRTSVADSAIRQLSVLHIVCIVKLRMYLYSFPQFHSLSSPWKHLHCHKYIDIYSFYCTPLLLCLNRNDSLTWCLCYFIVCFLLTDPCIPTL